MDKIYKIIINLFGLAAGFVVSVVTGWVVTIMLMVAVGALLVLLWLLLTGGSESLKFEGLFGQLLLWARHIVAIVGVGLSSFVVTRSVVVPVMTSLGGSKRAVYIGFVLSLLFMFWFAYLENIDLL